MDLITWTDKDLAVAMGSSNYPRESKVKISAEITRRMTVEFEAKQIANANNNGNNVVNIATRKPWVPL